MYLGIDLGTSNSAVVGITSGQARLFKTAEGTDVLPSAVMIDRRGNYLIGKRAYDQAAFSPGDVAQGFKRLLGTGSVIKFESTKRQMTPEEASSEVLKTLVAQAHMAVGDFEIAGAAVTVPAAFNQMQSEATMRAAGVAGLERVVLLQEPIAAAMASIGNSEKRTANFLVYDLGGGTFDAAIVQSVSGSATVIAHAGINMLGGRDFDLTILNTLVREWLLSNFDLPEDFQADKTYDRLLRVALYKAELSKIALSTQVSDHIFADENQIAAKDRSGKEIYLDVEITREHLNGLIEKNVGGTLELCESLLSQSGYSPGDMDRVVMIGGPSRTPYIRQQVASVLGIPIDIDTDPMTAVAMGAAIYAEGTDWGDLKSAKPKGTRASATSSGKVNVRYNYPERTPNNKANVRLEVVDSAGIEGLRVIVDTQGGWSTGQVPLTDKVDIKDIPLEKMGANKIHVKVISSAGNVRTEDEQELTITRIGASSGGMPLMHTVAIKVVTGAVGEERNTLMPLIFKGTPTPTIGATRLSAARDMRANDGSSLDFEIFEMVEDLTDPDLNLPIGLFQYHSSSLNAGEVVRRGDAVHIKWEVDSNGLLDCEISFEEQGVSYKTGKMYVPEASHRMYDGEIGKANAAAVIGKARNDVFEIEKALGVNITKQVMDFRRRLDQLDDDVRLSFDADTNRSIAEKARLLRQEIAKLRMKPEFEGKILRAEIDGFLSSFSDSLSDIMDEDTRAKVKRQAEMARDRVSQGLSSGIDDGRKSLKEARALVMEKLAALPQFWVSVFEDCAEERHLSIDKSQHDRLVKQGEVAINDGDIDRLRETIHQMRDNLILEADSGRTSALSGLMKF